MDPHRFLSVRQRFNHQILTLGAIDAAGKEQGVVGFAGVETFSVLGRVVKRGRINTTVVFQALADIAGVGINRLGLGNIAPVSMMNHLTDLLTVRKVDEICLLYTSRCV